MSIAGDKCDLCQLQMVLFFFFKMFQSNLRVLWEAEKIYIKFVDEREEMWGGKNVCRSCECVAAGVEWDHQSHSIKWNCLFLWPSRVLYWMPRGGQKAKPFHIVIVLPRSNFKLLNFSLTLNRRRNRQNERKKNSNWISKFQAVYAMMMMKNLHNEMSDLKSERGKAKTRRRIQI